MHAGCLLQTFDKDAYFAVNDRDISSLSEADGEHSGHDSEEEFLLTADDDSSEDELCGMSSLSKDDGSADVDEEEEETATEPLRR